MKIKYTNLLSGCFFFFLLYFPTFFVCKIPFYYSTRLDREHTTIICTYIVIIGVCIDLYRGKEGLNFFDKLMYVIYFPSIC